MTKAERKRCGWCGDDPQYVAYHDEEWGVAVREEQALFERLVLESMQAGLAWITILRKREAMREAFFDFAIPELAGTGERDVKRWLKNEGVIRHRGKLEAMVNNARCVQDMDDFSGFVWQFAPMRPSTYTRLGQVPSTTDESQQMSEALKKAGFKFVGPTTCYAFMQSVGMVNDHVRDCWRFDACARGAQRT